MGRGGERERKGREAGTENAALICLFFCPNDLHDQLLKAKAASLLWFKLGSGERAAK